MLRRVGLSQAETGTYRQEAKQADSPAGDLDARCESPISLLREGAHAAPPAA